MKNWKTFIIILSSLFFTKQLQACAFEGYNEDRRFCFFKPELFNNAEYNEFYYTLHEFSPSENPNPINQNIKEWKKYFHNQFNETDIYEGIFNINLSDNNACESNNFISYLQKNNKQNIINYIKFARSCEKFNGFYQSNFDSYQWEREETTISNEAYTQQLQLGDEKIKQEKDPYIKRRYAFLNLRMAYYANKSLLFESYHKKHFSKGTKDLLYYWALYFKGISCQNKEETNYILAQIFAHCPDKRFTAYQHFDPTIPIENVFKYCKNKQEKANIVVMQSIYRPDFNFENLTLLHKLNPQHPAFEFIIQREINKLEDWIYSPYYALIAAGLDDSSYEENHKTVMLERVELDRKYAMKLYGFIQKCSSKAFKSPLFKESAMVQLLFMQKKYTETINACNTILLNPNITTQLGAQINQIKALAITAHQQTDKAQLPSTILSILKQNEKDTKFIFALGRELEYLNNFTDACLVYSKLNDAYAYDYYSGISWNGKNEALWGYDYWYSNYMDYIDSQFSTHQIKALILYIQENTHNEDPTIKWKLENAKNAIAKLWDILGNKHMRYNELDKALNCYKKAQNHNQYIYNQTVVDETMKFNLYFTIKYTPHFTNNFTTMESSKISLLENLIKYKEKADSKLTTDKYYYAFLVGNAYYNISRFGYAYHMQHENWSAYCDGNKIEDEEFYQLKTATHYYDLAFKSAKTSHAKAFALRMLGHCHIMSHNISTCYSRQEYDDYEPGSELKIQYFKKLKEEFPEHYEPLMSNCDAFPMYFSKRK